MSNLLNSIKSDLLDRRLLPIAVLLGVALAAAVAYAVLAGGGSGSAATPVAATPSPSVSAGSSRPVTLISANPHAADSETTDGASFQRREGAHDPFVQLPSNTPKTALTAPTISAKASGGSSPAASTGEQTTASKPAGGGTTPAPTPQPAPHKPKTVHRLVFHVGVLFGLAPTTPGQTSQLTPYADLKRLEPLPSQSSPLVVFEGVSSDRKSAIFTLTREAIVKGSAICLPSSVQCEAIQLAVGQSEELQYLEANGQSVTYELALVSIAWHETTEARAARLDRPTHAGLALLRRLNPPVLRHMRFSAARGVLVYGPVRHHRHR